VCVGKGGPLFKSWDEITRGLGHHRRGVDVAKIDIEGHGMFCWIVIRGWVIKWLGLKGAG
jgi:hypothetical protein